MNAVPIMRKPRHSDIWHPGASSLAIRTSDGFRKKIIFQKLGLLWIHRLCSSTSWVFLLFVDEHNERVVYVVVKLEFVEKTTKVVRTWQAPQQSDLLDGRERAEDSVVA